MSAYAPGTVAMVETPHGPTVCTMAAPDYHSKSAHWHVASSSGYWLADGLDARPLVVIDVEPGDLRCVVQNLRTRADYMRHIDAPATDALLRGVADQIEAQTRPPKPEEPTGLGAVVEDAEGQKWLRDYDGYWRQRGLTAKWARVGAVRVLGEGVVER
jgi:hypothetical protein